MFYHARWNWKQINTTGSTGNCAILFLRCSCKLPKLVFLEKRSLYGIGIIFLSQEDCEAWSTIYNHTLTSHLSPCTISSFIFHLTLPQNCLWFCHSHLPSKCFQASSIQSYSVTVRLICEPYSFKFSKNLYLYSVLLNTRYLRSLEWHSIFLSIFTSTGTELQFQ
jgi:hypothetical protein